MPLGVEIQLFDGPTPQANLSDIQICWWDKEEPESFGSPTGISTAGSTDADGYIKIDLSAVTSLSEDDYGFLMLYQLDDVDSNDSLVFSARVQVDTITSGTVIGPTWDRPADWLDMPADATDQICLLVAVQDTDSQYATIKCATGEGYTVDWGDGSTPENVADNVVAEHEYDFDDTDLDGTLTTEGFKQAMMVVTPQSTGSFTVIRFDEDHSDVGDDIGQPYMEMQINAPSCTDLRTGGSGKTSCFSCRHINITAFSSAATNQSYMFYSNYSCQSYSFPAGFGSAATNQSYMFRYNYSCQSYNFPAGFGSVATDQGYMFYSNYSCQSYSFPAGFGSAATDQDYMFSYNYSCQSYNFPAGFGSVATNTTSMFDGCKARWINNFNLTNTTSLENNALSIEAIRQIISDLPTVSSETLTLTGNFGAADVVQDDIDDATAKGWTLVLS